MMSLDGCKRCPDCHLVPTVTFECPGTWLSCDEHGHRAVGDTLTKAVEHWNRYVTFVTGERTVNTIAPKGQLQ